MKKRNDFIADLIAWAYFLAPWVVILGLVIWLILYQTALWSSDLPFWAKLMLCGGRR